MNQFVVARTEMAEVAQKLLGQDARVWTFTGTLGAGKTTLVQEMLSQLGVTGPIQSPTYTYVSLYILPNGKRVYHFDLYRLSSYQEFIQAGFDEYLYDEQGYCFIEWPEIIDEHLPKLTTRVMLEYSLPDNRLITILQGR